MLLIALGSGSQVGPYAHSARNVILVVGHQKFVRDVEESLRRIHEYSLPLEDARMKRLGRPGSIVGKVPLLERERPGHTSVILVPETLDF